MRTSILLIVLSLFLAGCGSVEHKAPVRSSEAEAAFQLVQNAEGRKDDAARADLRSALGVFEALDDRPGRWAASAALANWHIAQREVETGAAYSRQAFELAPHTNSTHAMYESSLQLGQLTQDRDIILSAMPHAQNALETAVIHVLLNDHAAATQALAAYEQPANASRAENAARAFVLYRLGKHNGDKALVIEALKHYRLAADVYGVTDSLFLAATLETSPAAALELAQRALLSARQSGEPSRITVIAQWLALKGSQQ
ncbi:hypothetical protein GCM10022278_03470 [Allohahella marinimesophila]|uniref:Uncharacterized protein n=2 Tax=Allohahella marinimesophila TaxID=1054972 RepID=A0ABP7NHY8_9GAMM